MTNQTRLYFLIFVAFAYSASAQVLSIPMGGTSPGGLDARSMDAIQSTQMDLNVFRIDSQNQNLSPIESASANVSKLDLKAPRKAQGEYATGFRLLMLKDLPGAIDHLQRATAIYPKFVAAHNALGTTYLDLGQNQQARDEFAKAVELDDHLPNSYLNLGCAQLGLKEYAPAEESFRKASSIAPLDLQLLLALAYGEFENHDYPAVIATTQTIHERKHEGASVVHFFAAGAWEAQGDLGQAQEQLETLLREEPKSASAEQFRVILDGIKGEEVRQTEEKLHPQQAVKFSFNTPAGPTAEAATRQAQQMLQDIKEKNQIAEAEAEPADACGDCSTMAPALSPRPRPALLPGAHVAGTTTIRTAVDEVAVVFAATDHGKSATDLTLKDIEVRDDNQPPNSILGFRTESELPLRMGLIIDTSNSILSRFSFETSAATRFVQSVATHADDLSFVIGVNNSVLLVQDFTGDQALASHAINELAPGGGTALWDAVAFAADKLASHKETEPVARVLVLISDGQDNSSSITLKEAISHAQRGEVAVYTVSTRDGLDEEAGALLGEHALRTLSELTGGAAFSPGSMHRLKGSLTDLQQVIRGRYLVSYKPASFQRDGRYRSINIKATKDGHPLKVYARKGYYASAAQTGSASNYQ